MPWTLRFYKAAAGRLHTERGDSDAESKQQKIKENIPFFERKAAGSKRIFVCPALDIGYDRLLFDSDDNLDFIHIQHAFG